MTLCNNTASRRGAVLAGHAHRRARLVNFLHAAGRYYFDAGPHDYLARPGLRFGFNSDPYLDPYAASAAPDRTARAGAGPWVPERFRLQLPDDGRLTDQWPFHGTGERHAAYRDPRTPAGQKAASGGAAFLLQAEGDGWAAGGGGGGGGAAAAARAAGGGGLVAFKDCNVYGNEPAAEAACYFHAELDTMQCVEEKRLL